MNFKARQERLRDVFKEKPPSVIILTTLPNMKYFLNYSGRSFERFACGIFSIESGRSVLVIPKLDEPKSKQSVVDTVCSWTDSEGYKDSLISGLKDAGFSRGKVGCENALTFGQWNALKDTIKETEFLSVSEEMAELREVKSSEEVESLISAGKILEKSFKGLENNGEYSSVHSRRMGVRPQWYH